MQNIRYKFILFLSLINCYSFIDAADVVTSSIKNDLRILKQSLEVIHPGYERYTTENQRHIMWRNINQKIDENSSLSAVFKEISALTAQLRCEHTTVELPQSLMEVKKQRFMPFHFRLFNERMFIDKASSDLGLNKGDEIISINGRNIRESIIKISPFMTRDGYTDHVIDRKIENDFDILGSGFEQFFAFVVLGLESYPNEYTIEYRQKNQREKFLKKIDTISFKQWLALKNVEYRLDFKDAINYKIYDEYAVLTVNTFVNYRNPVDAMKIFNKIFTEFRNKKIKHLIVDLRQNGGGSDDAQLALLRHLFNQPFQVADAAWFKYDDLGELKKYLQTWDQNVLSPDVSQLESEALGYRVPNVMMGPQYALQQPAKMSFNGEIYMLTSRENASASASLLSLIKQENNVKLVGEATGGNQGGTTATVMLFLKLPHTGITVKIPVFRNQYMIKDKKDGQGAEPDYYAYENLHSWLSDEDPAMLKAIELIKQ